MKIWTRLLRFIRSCDVKVLMKAYKKKVKKFIRSPGLFLTDYFNKKYPSYTNEQKVLVGDEAIVVDYELQLCALEDSLGINHDPVDVVFTWVDSADPSWRNRYNLASQAVNKPIGLYANDEARFENHNELYYSVHSVLKYLDWANHIFIVTDGQTPDWLQDINTDKITIIDHRQIIDEQYLPTFNSQVIEANLHKIPNLSENFIYFNDDVFVARPLPRTHFFSHNGNASIFFADKSLFSMQEKGVMTPTLFACMNGQKLLSRHYHANLDVPLVHTYIPLKKSYFEKAWQLYEDEIRVFLINKFRSNNDLNMATFLVPYLMYLDGKSAVRREVCYYFNIRSNNAKAQYDKLLSKKEFDEPPHSFCANDFYSETQVPNFRENLENFLKEYFIV